MESAQIRVLGARGSTPVAGKDYLKYGGSTSCYLVHMGGETILLDGGSGLLRIKKYLGKEERALSLLLSHPHLDHLIGLTMCPVLFEPEVNLKIYAVPRGGRSAFKQVEAITAEPLWPVRVSDFNARISICDISESSFQIGKVQIDCMEGNHPGGCTIFRLSCQGKSVVYATDFEQGSVADHRLREIADHCDLLLCDGQYTQEELYLKRGFGHSCQSFVAELGKDCGVGKTFITHHGMQRTDEVLSVMEQELCGAYANCYFAKEGQEIII